MDGYKVGLLDIDIHGPSVPKLLNIEDRLITAHGENMIPICVGENLKVISIGLMSRDHDTAIIWRGPMKYQMIKQFLKDVEWGQLDYLVIDSPPGTGDEPLSIAQLLENPDGAVIVTTPQDVALADVRKGINFCKSLQLPVLGVIENMSGFVCPKCSEVIDIFKSGGGELMATQMGVPFLGKIPLDPQIVQASDAGKPFIYHNANSPAAKAFKEAINVLLNQNNTGEFMRFAIPTADNKLCQHFGHCDIFTIIDVDEATKTIKSTQQIEPPPHEPGVLPVWLHKQGVNIIIAGGMGQHAQQLFSQNKIDVVVGAPVDTPEKLVSAYLNKTLQSGTNLCDH